MKLKPADTAFSKCVRLASNYTCQKCGAQHDEKSKGLHTHHLVPRNVRRTRWDKLCCVTLCFSCHRWWHDYPYESGQWTEEYLGKGGLELLREKANSFVKVPKSEEPLIAKHYRSELKRMITENDTTFESWQ